MSVLGRDVWGRRAVEREVDPAEIVAQCRGASEGTGKETEWLRRVDGGLETLHTGSECTTTFGTRIDGQAERVGGALGSEADVAKEEGLGWSRPCLTDERASEEERCVGFVCWGDSCKLDDRKNKLGWKDDRAGIRVGFTGGRRSGRVCKREVNRDVFRRCLCVHMSVKHTEIE